MFLQGRFCRFFTHFTTPCVSAQYLFAYLRVRAMGTLKRIDWMQTNLPLVVEYSGSLANAFISLLVSIPLVSKHCCLYTGCHNDSFANKTICLENKSAAQQQMLNHICTYWLRICEREQPGCIIQHWKFILHKVKLHLFSLCFDVI